MWETNAVCWFLRTNESLVLREFTSTFMLPVFFIFKQFKVVFAIEILQLFCTLYDYAKSFQFCGCSIAKFSLVICQYCVGQWLELKTIGVASQPSCVVFVIICFHFSCNAWIKSWSVFAVWKRN